MNLSKIPVALVLALLVGAGIAVLQRKEASPQPPASENRAAPRAAEAGQDFRTTSVPSDNAGSSGEAFAPLPWSRLRGGSPVPQAASAPPLSPDEVRARKLKALGEILDGIDALDGLPEEHRDRLARYAGQLATLDTPRVQCWSQDTPPEVVRAYLRVEQHIAAAGGFGVQALRVNNHWSRTATNGNGQGAQGLPVTLTWSIVPDGTPISSSGGTESTDPSSLRARMAEIYGGSATGDPAAQPWFPVFQAVFDNLAAISGLRFVYEPNDDAKPISGFSQSGTLGIRGDIRLGGHLIDGNSGTLAYAYYPDNGDVVIDTGDNYIATTSNNSIRLRNILEHEIGHSLGLAHVCPINSTKLMEPYINTGFRGSQFDDIYSHQRNYGDPLEVHGALRDNDTAANATPLPLVPGVTSAWEWLSIDDNGDTDFYSFPATHDQQVTVRIIPSDPISPGNPANNTYLEGPQIGGECASGTAFDPTNQHDLVLDLLGTNGTTVVTSAPVQAAGLTETITAFQLPADGPHYIRVRGGSTDRAQLYRMEVLLVEAPPAPRLAITSTRLDAESNSGANGAPDPGETIRLGITLANDGNLAAADLTATLSAPAGSTLFSAVENYGTLDAGASGERLFTFALAGLAGETVPLQLTLSATGYSVVLPLSLTLGTSVASVPLEEHFDDSSGLPAGWSESTSGAGSPWVVSTNRFNSAPNSMFSPSVSPNGEALLVSPAVAIGEDGGVLEFLHRYELELTSDGGVVEASRNGGAWFDLLNSAATVQAGDYSGTIRSNSSSSIKGREAWTGSTATFVTTRVKLPAAWVGENIAFRWRLVHNSATTLVGWNVDDVKFSSSVPVADPFRPHLSLSASGTTLSEMAPASAVTLTLSTPLPLVQDVSVTLEATGTAGEADIEGSLTLVLPAGQTSVSTEITAKQDSQVEGAESLVLSIPPSAPGFDATAPSSVSLDIEDNSALPALVTLTDLSVTYDGTAKSATVTTTPAGLSCAVTYDGLAQVPTHAGNYAVVATITDPGYQGTASATLVIGKAMATVTLGDLAPTYDGTAKSASAITVPASLPVTFTYDGESQPPTDAGSHAVVATINDANHEGTANDVLVIGKAPATVTLGDLSPTYDGTARSASATTVPASLPVTFTYDGESQPPTDAGSYAVVATVNDANHEGTANDVLMIGKATATVTLGSLSVTYDGTPKAATAITVPADLPVTFTYDGTSEAPVAPGSHAVVATIDDANHEGSASGTLVIVSAYAGWISSFIDPQDPDALPSADLDGDGWDNASEYVFGTVPDDPASFPRLQPVLAPDSLRLMLPAAPVGATRFVETSADLGTWTTDGVTAIEGGYQVPRDASRRFLRVVYDVTN